MSQPPIYNAADNPLSISIGTLPNVNDALADWFQPVTFGVITKTIVNFQNKETVVDITFNGVVQPLEARKLKMMPHGQRKWPPLMVHSDPSLELAVDDVIIYLAVQYRVMEKLNYTAYGYNEYHLIQDYTGSGPTP